MADIVYTGETPKSVLNADAMPANFDMKIYKGDYVELFIIVEDSASNPLDLTGLVPRSNLRLNYFDEAAVSFTCTLTGVAGEVRIYLPSSASRNLAVGSYIWDFEIVKPNGDSRTYLTGDVEVLNEVTKAV